MLSDERQNVSALLNQVRGCGVDKRFHREAAQMVKIFANANAAWILININPILAKVIIIIMILPSHLILSKKIEWMIQIQKYRNTEIHIISVSPDSELED